MDETRPRPSRIKRLIPAGIMLAGALVLAGLTEEAGEGELTWLDHAPALKGGPAWLAQSARDVSALGGFTLLSLVCTVAALVLWRLGRRAQAGVFVGAVVLSQVVASVFKAVIHRPRPDAERLVDYVYASSFPSGHATMSPAVYLTLAALLATGFPRFKGLIWSVAVLIVLLVGLSRVYLGVHWPTDVVAGWILGAGLAAGAVAVLKAVKGGGR